MTQLDSVKWCVFNKSRDVFCIIIILWPTSSSYLSPQCLQCYNRP